MIQHRYRIHKEDRLEVREVRRPSKFRDGSTDVCRIGPGYYFTVYQHHGEDGWGEISGYYNRRKKACEWLRDHRVRWHTRAPLRVVAVYVSQAQIDEMKEYAAEMQAEYEQYAQEQE